MNQIRIKGLIDEAIQKHKLNLDNLVILTEAATGYFFTTPIIAAMAGAKKVMAIAKNSSYGSAGRAINYSKKAAKLFGVVPKITFVDKLTPALIEEADIITNLGFVRPIDQNFIQHMKPRAVIPLMYESWELRKEDIDLEACRRKEILVMATNEEAPNLEVFAYVKPLIYKILLAANFEIYKNSFLILSGDNFGKTIKKGLEKMTSSVLLKNPKNFKFEKIAHKRLDAIIVADYLSNKVIIGEKGLIKPSKIKEQFPGVTIIQFAGQVKIKELAKNNLPFYPNYQVGPHKMIYSFNDLGPKPVIELHTAGLKVGEIMARARLGAKNYQAARKKSLTNRLCQEVKGDGKK